MGGSCGWRRSFTPTRFVGNSGWRVPPKPTEEGNYVLEVEDTGSTGWRKTTENGDITLEDLGGAKLNGDCSEQFSVADATEDCHAINKKQFDEKIEELLREPIDGGNFV